MRCYFSHYNQEATMSIGIHETKWPLSRFVGVQQVSCYALSWKCHNRQHSSSSSFPPTQCCVLVTNKVSPLKICWSSTSFILCLIMEVSQQAPRHYSSSSSFPPTQWYVLVTNLLVLLILGYMKKSESSQDLLEFNKSHAMLCHGSVTTDTTTPPAHPFLQLNGVS
jgi:hypothetical protein